MRSSEVLPGTRRDLSYLHRTINNKKYHKRISVNTKNLILTDIHTYNGYDRATIYLFSLQGAFLKKKSFKILIIAHQNYVLTIFFIKSGNFISFAPSFLNMNVTMIMDRGTHRL